MRIATQRLIAATTVLLLGACTEPTTSTPLPISHEPSSPSSRSIKEGDVVITPRFDVAIAASGRIAVGSPISISYRTAARFATSGAVISLQAPEVQLARASGWKNATARARLSVSPLDETAMTMGSGQQFEREFTVTLERPGIYRFIVAATAPSAPTIEPKVGYVRNAVSQEMWVLVTPNGGRVLSDLDPGVFGDSLVSVPGPFRLRNRNRRAAQSSALSKSTIPNTIDGHVMYYDPSLQQYVPMPWLMVQGREWSSYENQYVGGAAGMTDQDGYFQMNCPEYNNKMELSISLNGSVAYVEPGTIGGPETWGWECEAGTDASFQLTGTAAEAAYTFQQINDVAGIASTLFGKYRSQVLVRFVDTGISDYEKEQPWGPTGTADRITLSRANGIFGSWARFTIAHEYGHAMHHRSFGGYPASLNCPSPHPIDGDEDTICAYVEGFADFFGVAIGGPATGYLSTLDANYWYHGGDGSRVEGAVAAFLYDLTDPANESHDTLALPFGYVGNVMSSCSVTLGGVSVHAYRISHLIYCMENTVDVAAKSYFSTDAAVFGESESVAEPPGWSQPGIRSLWLRNLFGI